MTVMLGLEVATCSEIADEKFQYVVANSMVEFS